MKNFLQVIDSSDNTYVINPAHISYVRPDDFESFSKSGCVIVVQTGSDTKEIYVDAGEQTQSVLNALGYQA